MLHTMIKKLKVLLPRNVKEKVKKVTGLGMTSEKVNTFSRVETDPGIVNIAVHTGGGLGDFIVYSALFDQLAAVCDCKIYIFTLSYANATTVLGHRPHVEIYYPLRPISRKHFDVILEIDHYIHVAEFSPFRLKRKSKRLYDMVQHIIRHNKVNIPIAATVQSQRLLLLRRAKFLNLNRWTQLSGGVFDMDGMRTDILVPAHSSILQQYGLAGEPYVTIHYGTDPDAGGERQTKLWPYENFREFVSLFQLEYPHIKVVQLAANAEARIPGVDSCIYNAALDDVKVVLQSAITHISSEGGIAHLATQAGTRCVVLFGPTPAYYYGYPTNINIVSPLCKECMEISPDWFTKCPRGLERAECMRGISAQTVLEAVRQLIADRAG